jgi:hypothetical protein
MFWGVTTIPRCLAAAASIALSSRLIAAQASVSGIVRDSLAKTPLRGAIVQLVHVDSLSGRRAITDSLGRYAIRDVAPGRYHVGFLHPVLDSLGLEPIVHTVEILGELPVRADLAVPPAAKLREAMCGGRAQGKAVITGFVRDAVDDSPVAGATVAADWLELTFQKGGIVRVMPRSDAISAANGWFALCDVPSDGTMRLFASRGPDSTDVLDVHVSPDGFLRHDLYLGHAQRGTLTGTVVSASNGERLSGATISVVGGKSVRADDHGEWTLTDLPLGTRNIEVRAVGFYPERHGVHVTAGAPTVRFGLSSLRAVLDTVRIRAARLQDRRASGFEERRRTSAGFYLTADQIAKKGAHNTADIFQGLRGLRLGYASDTLLSDNMMLVDPDSLKTIHRQILMRGISGDLCAPSIFLNGISIDRLDADDLDAWATPKEIGAIEIYSEATVPAQFQRVGKACGAIIIWTKRL